MRKELSRPDLGWKDSTLGSSGNLPTTNDGTLRQLLRETHLRRLQEADGRDGDVNQPTKDLTRIFVQQQTEIEGTSRNSQKSRWHVILTGNRRSAAYAEQTNYC